MNEKLWADSEIEMHDGVQYLNVTATLRFYYAYQDYVQDFVPGSIAPLDWVQQCVAYEPMTEERWNNVVIGFYEDYKKEGKSLNDFLRVKLRTALARKGVLPEVIKKYGLLIDSTFDYDEFVAESHKNENENRLIKKVNDCATCSELMASITDVNELYDICLLYSAGKTKKFRVNFSEYAYSWLQSKYETMNVEDLIAFLKKVSKSSGNKLFEEIVGTIEVNYQQTLDAIIEYLEVNKKMPARTNPFARDGFRPVDGGTGSGTGTGSDDGTDSDGGSDSGEDEDEDEETLTPEEKAQEILDSLGKDSETLSDKLNNITDAKYRKEVVNVLAKKISNKILKINYQGDWGKVFELSVLLKNVADADDVAKAVQKTLNLNNTDCINDVAMMINGSASFDDLLENIKDRCATLVKNKQLADAADLFSIFDNIEDQILSEEFMDSIDMDKIYLYAHLWYGSHPYTEFDQAIVIDFLACVQDPGTVAGYFDTLNDDTLVKLHEEYKNDLGYLKASQRIAVEEMRSRGLTPKHDEEKEESFGIVNRWKAKSKEDRKKVLFATVAGVGVISCALMTFVLKMSPINAVTSCASAFANLLKGNAHFAELLGKLGSLTAYFGSIAASIVGIHKFSKLKFKDEDDEAEIEDEDEDDKTLPPAGSSKTRR